MLDDQDFRQVWIDGHDGRGQGFDQIDQLGVGEAAANRANRRRGEDDVTDQAGTNEQNPQTETSYGRVPASGFASPSIVASSISMTGMSSLMG